MNVMTVSDGVRAWHPQAGHRAGSAVSRRSRNRGAMRRISCSEFFVLATIVTMLHSSFAVGFAAVVERHGNKITIKPFDWLKKKPGSNQSPAGRSNSELDQKGAPPSQGAKENIPPAAGPVPVRDNAPFLYAFMPDGYLLTQFVAKHPAKESDLHLASFWAGAIDKQHELRSSDEFRNGALPLFLQSLHGDIRVACSEAAADLLHVTSWGSYKDLDALVRRHDPVLSAVKPKTEEEVWDQTFRVRSKLPAYQVSLDQTRGIRKVRFYYVGASSGSRSNSLGGEFAVHFQGPSGFTFFMKHGSDYVNEFDYANGKTSVVKMSVEEAQKVTQSGDYFAFAYEIEGVVCTKEEIARLAQFTPAPILRDLVVEVSATKLYLLRVPSQAGGRGSAKVSLMKSDASLSMTPLNSPQPAYSPSVVQGLRSPGASTGGRSPERQRQIDEAVGNAHRARAEEEARTAEAIGQGAYRGSNPFRQ